MIPLSVIPLSGFANNTLQGFKEEPLGFELVEEVGVDDEDGVVEDVAERRADHQQFAAVAVGPRTGKQRVNHCRNGLKTTAIVTGSKQ